MRIAFRFLLITLLAALLAGCPIDESSSSSSSTSSPETEGTGSPDGESDMEEDADPEVVIAAREQPRSTGRPMPQALAEMEPAACNGAEEASMGGRSYRVEVPSRVDGAAIVFQVLEPEQIDCRQGSPLILQGHGFSGSRATSASGEIAMLVDGGYTVISIDQRGHGESGGTVRVMDPDFEGEDLVQIVDWAEENLDYLAYRGDRMLLGAIGSSYGGGFQYLLYHVDPDQRIQALVPDITWHDLTYSLNPGNVTKNFWLLILSALGDAGTGFNMDPFIRSTLVDGIVENRFPETALDFFYYHGSGYFMDNSRGVELFDSENTQEYLLDPLLGQLPITGGSGYIIKTPVADAYPVDVLMFQSTRDNLFPFNDAFDNYKAYQAVGGDVRLLTHEAGHEFLSPSLGTAQQALGNLDFFLRGGFGEGTGCGEVDKAQATLAWFDDKLLGQGNADEVITSGQQICYTLGPGDSVTTPEVTVGGRDFPLTNVFGQEGGSVTALTGPNVLPAIIDLGVLDEDAVIAGVPTANITLSRGSETLDGLCLDQSLPILNIGTCDAILFAGIGVLRQNTLLPELLDEQVMPIRGLGQHELELTGIAERLQEGDRLLLMLYGHHPTFVGAFSRDLTTLLLQVSGSVQLPLLSPDGQSVL
ncbi:MAG: peptidase S15 [Halomonadaceae bacterium]|nr:MAG: peptidase S15 [Halomonadaceae bacterium]